MLKTAKIDLCTLVSDDPTSRQKNGWSEHSAILVVIADDVEACGGQGRCHSKFLRPDLKSARPNLHLYHATDGDGYILLVANKSFPFFSDLLTRKAFFSGQKT